MSQFPQYPQGADGAPYQSPSGPADPYASPAPGAPGAAWQGAGAAWPGAGPAPYRKSVAAVVFGVLLLGLAALFALGALANIATGGMNTGGDPAYAVGYLIGMLLMIVLPAALGIFLLTLNGRRRRRAEAQRHQGGHPW